MVNYLDGETTLETKEDTRRDIALSDDDVFRSLLNGLKHGTDETELLAERVVFDMRTDQFRVSANQCEQTSSHLSL